MEYKFEKLKVWKLAMKFNDLSYQLAECLPEREKFNLNSQLIRAATSIALNIAEGSTGQTDAEQSRFLSYAIRSHIEVIACIRLMENRNYLNGQESLQQQFESVAVKLFNKLQAFKKALS
ncbi:MAG TPA: four helix bundle protein [Balneolaceae bacterium]|nr:four helix bundle protein [Balneolaceae bacterium]